MKSSDTQMELVRRYLGGEATLEEVRRLESMLAVDAQLRRDYLAYARVEAGLSSKVRPKLVKTPPRRSVWLSWRPLAAAAVVIGCGMAAWWQSTAVAIEVLAAKDVNFRPGGRMRCKAIELEGGELTFRLSSGAVIDLVGPASLTLLNSMHVRLQRGQVTVDAGRQGKGFVVDTATAHVVDLGTRFGVSTGAAAVTDVAVFEGSVEVYQPDTRADRKPDVKLVEGEAVRLEKSQSPMRLKVIRVGAGGQKLAAGSSADVVSGVTDNVIEDNFRGFYGLMRGGMAEGSPVYTSGHTRTWHPIPGESFPEELRGADVICTFSRDRRQPDLEISLMVERACEIFIMLDTRAAIPEWVRNDFTDTELRLRSGPWGMLPTPTGVEENGYVTHAVWKKVVMQPGAVTLGSPESASGKMWTAMYGIAVKERR